MAHTKTLHKRKNNITEKHVTFNVIGKGYSFTVKLVNNGYLQVIANAVDREIIIDKNGEIIISSRVSGDYV